ncbi:MAG: cupin domain-containing protein [Betaproteobacteria bacterium]
MATHSAPPPRPDAKRVIDLRVVNIDALLLEHFAKGLQFACDAVRIGPLLGAKDLGFSYDVVPPGKRSCPFHSHRAEEEMFFIVRGTGTLRYGDETRPIRAGDVICCPTGGPETAHQIVNDSDGELAYLSISTMMRAEVCEYPDSKKVGAFGEGGLRHMTRSDHHLDYWTDEI